MRKLFDRLVLGVVGLLMSAVAVAAPLTQAQVKNYIASFVEAQALAEQNPSPQKSIDRHRPLVSGIELPRQDRLIHLQLLQPSDIHQPDACIAN